MDFKLFLKDTHSHNTAFVVINQLYKQSISLLYFKTITAKDIARLYINNIYWFYSTPKSIVSNYSPQFILDFWNKFCRILRIKIKLFTVFYPQTNGQTKIINQYLDQRLRPFVNYY